MNNEKQNREDLPAIPPPIEFDGVPVSLAPARFSRTTPIARIISNVGSPPALGAAAVVLGSAVTPTFWGWIWAVFYMLATLIAPILYVADRVRKGYITDIHLPLRSERMRPMLLALALSVGAWATLMWVEAPPLLRLLATANLIQSALFLLVTMYWKMSLHSATAALLAAFVVYLGGQVSAVTAIAVVPVVGWSRVYLQRHTLAQVIVGATSGLAIFLVAVYFSPAL